MAGNDHTVNMAPQSQLPVQQTQPQQMQTDPNQQVYVQQRMADGSLRVVAMSAAEAAQYSTQVGMSSYNYNSTPQDNTWASNGTTPKESSKGCFGINIGSKGCDTDPASMGIFASCLIEFCAVFMFSMIMFGVANTGTQVGPIAIGAGAVALIYMAGHVSGGHINPMTTLAMQMTGNMDSCRAIWGYFFAQCSGAIMAGLASTIVGNGLDTAHWGVSVGGLMNFGDDWQTAMKVFAVELLGTYLLISTVLHTMKVNLNNYANSQFFGMAIGFVIIALTVAFGPVSGGLFNPALVFGTAVSQAMYSDVTVSWLAIITMCAGELVGAALGAWHFSFTFAELGWDPSK